MDALITALLPQAPTLAAVIAMAWLVWSRLLRIEARLDALESEQADAKSERKQILEALHKLDNKIVEIDERVKKLEGWVSSLSARIKELEKSVSALEQKVAVLERFVLNGGRKE